MPTEEKIAHLGFIQSVINRVANNSFLIKGWAVTLVAAVLSLSSNDSNKNYFLIALIPTFIFWAMDAYFFYQEKLYRELYYAVIEENSEIKSFNLNTDLLKNKIDSACCHLFKMAVFPIYVSLSGIVLLVIFGVLKIQF